MQEQCASPYFFLKLQGLKGSGKFFWLIYWGFPYVEVLFLNGLSEGYARVNVNGLLVSYNTRAAGDV